MSTRMTVAYGKGYHIFVECFPDGDGEPYVYVEFEDKTVHEVTAGPGDSKCAVVRLSGEVLTILRSDIVALATKMVKDVASNDEEMAALMEKSLPCCIEASEDKGHSAACIERARQRMLADAPEDKED